MTVPQYNLSKSTHQCESEPAADYYCHCEGRSPVAISWYSVATSWEPKASTIPLPPAFMRGVPEGRGGVLPQYEFAEVLQ